MGGHQGGDFASRLAVETVREEILKGGEVESSARKLLEGDPALRYAWVRPPGAPPKRPAPEMMVTLPPSGGMLQTDPVIPTPPAPAATVLRAAARVAGRAIFDAGQRDAGLHGMGTTLTALFLHGGRAHLAHVGDSRGFLFRGGRIEQITEDHSWIAEQIRAGAMSEEEAKGSRFKHIITRSVGFEREVDVDLIGLPIEAGDCFVLCSDGCSNFIDKEELGRIMATTYYRRVPQLLVDLANDRGGDDNITAVVVVAANEARAKPPVDE